MKIGLKAGLLALFFCIPFSLFAESYNAANAENNDKTAIAQDLSHANTDLMNVDQDLNLEQGAADDWWGWGGYRRWGWGGWPYYRGYGFGYGYGYPYYGGYYGYGYPYFRRWWW